MVIEKKFPQESLGIGLTSLCNLNCRACYSRGLKRANLSLREIKRIINKFPKLKKINFGTGESFLNPSLKDIINFFYSKNIKIALTSNGFTISRLPEKYLKMIDEVDISIDFPERNLHDSWRNKKGIYDIAISSIEKCKKLGIKVSIATILMNKNYKYLKKFRVLLDRYNIYLRVNLYKPVNTKKYELNYSEFWSAMKIIAKNFTLVSNSEPILSLITPSISMNGCPCGKNSLRVHADKSISPCVYIDGNKISINKFISFKKIIPEFCKKCDFVENCKGGCLSRRIFNNKINEPDCYCPIYRGEKIPKIKFSKICREDFIHSNYLCTFILK